MRHICSFITLVLFCCHTPALSQVDPPQRNEIGILGMFHLGNTNDMASVKLDDLSSEKRQNEIEELVNNLKEYKP